MEPLTPQDPHRIGPYRLLARLGEGGMGTVYLARSDRGRTVAVKTIIGSLAQQPDFRRRFAQEITAAQRVGGQWTAPVLDADTTGAMPWVATGYIAGPSLQQVVGGSHGPLPERSVLLLAGGLAQALAAIHGAGLVHRDLKPSNVLMTLDGPRVIDFGIARGVEVAPGEGLTRTGATIGSPGFMSPEQVRGQQLTPASDIFCLGSLLAFAATGHTPFGSLDTGMHVLMFRIAEELPDLSGVPESLKLLISGCMHKDPAQRTPMAQLLRQPAPATGGVAEADGEPWLPSSLVAQLGRDAVSLLDAESAETGNIPMVSPQPGPTGGVGPTSPAPPGAPTSPPAPGQNPGQHPGQNPVKSPGPTAAPSPYASAATSPYPGPHSGPHPAPHPGPHSGPHSGGFGPSPYGSGGSPAYGGSPYASPPPPGRPGQPDGRSRRNWIVLVAVVAVCAVLGSVGAALMLGGDDEGGKPGDGQTTAIDNTPVGKGYIGAWQGEIGERGAAGWKALWFEIHQGRKGESVGTATITAEEWMCVYDVRLASFGKKLKFTEVADFSVPETAVQDTCRDNPTEQSLQLRDNGSMRWVDGQQTADLQKSGPDAQDAVPSELLDSWHDPWTTEEGEDAVDDVTIEQGSIGDPVLRYTWIRGDTTCVLKNHLAQVDGETILLGPDVVIEAESDEECEGTESFWAWRESSGNLMFLWTPDPDSDPFPIR